MDVVQVSFPYQTLSEPWPIISAVAPLLACLASEIHYTAALAGSRKPAT